MSELIVDLDRSVVDQGGHMYFVNVVAEEVGDSWEAWLEFVPTDDSNPFLTATETTQATRSAVTRWAQTLDDVYIQGAFHRAAPPDSTQSDRLRSMPVNAAGPLNTTASLDPFAVYTSLGKDAFRRQLTPLTRTELLTTIELYDLDPAGVSLTRLTNSQLVTFIIIATEVQVQQGRRE